VLASAAMTALAFPPLDAGFLAWICLAPVLVALGECRRPRSAFALGYLFGSLHWGATIVWIGTTVTNWTGSPIGWAAWVVLTAIKSLWFGLFGFLGWWVIRRAGGVSRAVGLACAWTLVEWLRTQSSVAMPWSLLGYTQYRFLPVAQIADLAGVFGVTFVLTLVNGGFAEQLRARREGAQPSRRPLAVGAGVAAAALLYGAAAMARDYRGPEVTLALVQPNDRSLRQAKEDPAAQWVRALETLDRYTRLNAQAAAGTPAMVIWPESSAPFSAVTEPRIRAAFGRFAREADAWQFTGTDYTDPEERSYNAAALFAPDGELAARYDKQWLVPMGEWVPMRRWLPFGDVFGFPDDVTPGTGDDPLRAGIIRFAPLICYESVFPIVSRVRAARGANLLVSITNDSWAGESAELQQHIAMTAFRAIETRRYLASSATTGITAIVSPDGAMKSVPPYREAVLVGSVRLLEGVTWYARAGDWLVAVCAAAIGMILLRGRN
jgi:apolipoprotein N-acyltransferase